ncbi:hypothetical protein V5735_20065 [Haladaptatus sp. SPP-AMP-3]
METLGDVFKRTPGVLDYEVSVESDGVAYVHYESTPLMAALLAAVFEHTIVLQWPLEYVTDTEMRALRETFMGSETELKNVTSEIPDSFELSLVRTGEYNLTSKWYFSSLVHTIKHQIDNKYHHFARSLVWLLLLPRNGKEFHLFSSVWLIIALT